MANLIHSKIKHISVTHELFIYYKDTTFEYLVETTKNNEIIKININHSYFLKRKTRKMFMVQIRNHFTKTN